MKKYPLLNDAIKYTHFYNWLCHALGTFSVGSITVSEFYFEVTTFRTLSQRQPTEMMIAITIANSY